jgi:hypothetical protein
LIVFLGVLTALAVRKYFAATLRVADDGFEIGKHKVAWTDVAAFRPGPRFIRVLYAPGPEPGRSAAVTETLGKVGVYLPRPISASSTRRGPNVETCTNSARRPWRELCPSAAAGALRGRVST